MRFVSLLVIAGLFLSAPTLALAGVDGNELLQKCGPINRLYEDPTSLDNREASGIVYCLGYIDSFIETFYFQRQAQIVPAIPFCMPDSAVVKNEITQKVVEFLERQPEEEMEKPAGYLLFMALRQAYPCGEKETAEKDDGKEPEQGSEESPAQ